jgi:hypothetical protein
MPKITLLLSMALLQQPTTGNDRQQDVYAVYSVLVTSPDSIYLIQSTTLRYVDPTSGCIQAPPQERTDLAEIQADYELRKDATPALTRDLRLSKPYQFLGSAEVEKFLKDALEATPQILPRGGTAPPNPNPLFPQAKRVFRLGDVYFNKNGTMALVYSGVYETTMDYFAGWKAFRKSADGKWSEDRSWRTCGQGAGR